MPLNGSEKQNKEHLIQLVVFHIEDEEFGVPIDDIQEIIKVGTITPIPDMPDFIRGVINVRGDIVTTIDIKSRFSIPEKRKSSSRHVMITRQKDCLFGLIVDEVTEVLRIDEKEIKPPPSMIAQIDKAFVEGIVPYEERLLILLDLTKVLSEQEFARLAKISNTNQQYELGEQAKALPKKSLVKTHRNPS